MCIVVEFFGRVKERHSQRSHIQWFVSQMSTVAGVGPQQSQEPGIQSTPALWAGGTQPFALLPFAFGKKLDLELVFGLELNLLQFKIVDIANGILTLITNIYTQSVRRFKTISLTYLFFKIIWIFITVIAFSFANLSSRNLTFLFELLNVCSIIITVFLQILFVSMRFPSTVSVFTSDLGDLCLQCVVGFISWS